MDKFVQEINENTDSIVIECEKMSKENLDMLYKEFDKVDKKLDLILDKIGK